MTAVCEGSGRAVAFPGLSRRTCPWCGRKIATTSKSKLRRHDVRPVVRGVAYDEAREEWVAAVQYRSIIQLHPGDTALEAEARARSSITKARRMA